ncbi:MAG: hypothetical protein ACP5N1_00020 [Candidatus Woesearchaeota archaeon]
MKKLLIFLLVLLFANFVSAADGFVAYRNATGATTPFLKLWDSSGDGSFSSEIILPTSGSNIRQMIIKSSPISSKMVLITSSDDGYLDAYVCLYNCTYSDFWTYTSNFVSTSVSAQKRFDLGFESATGDLIVVYGINSTDVNEDLAYLVLPAAESNFVDIPINYIDDTTSGANIVYSWISMDSNPINDSEELTLIGFDSTGSDVLSWIWNGTSFYNQFELSTASTSTTSYEAIATRYSSSGSRSIIAAGTGTVGNFATAYWDSVSKSWSGITSTDIDGTDSNDIRWVTLKPNPVNNDMQAVIVDSGSDLTTAYWNDSSSLWTYTPNINLALDIATTRPVDFSWVSNGSFGKLVWDNDTTGVTLSQRTCSPLCNGVSSTISTYSNTGRWIAMYRNPTIDNNVDFLGLRLDSVFQLGAFYYNGTDYTNYGNSTLSISTGTATYESFAMAFIDDRIVPKANFIDPTPNISEIINSTDSVTIVINASESLLTSIIEFNGTNYSMDPSDVSFNHIWSLSFSSLLNGTYTYKVYLTDWYGNSNSTSVRNFTINYTYIVPSNNFISSPVEAIITYRNAVTGASIPAIRFWNSSNFGVFSSEIQLPNSGSNIRQNIIKMSPVSSKTVIITSSDDGNLDAYVCMYNCTYSSSWAHTSNIANVGVNTQRRYDFGFETLTGDLIFVYATTSASVVQDLAYIVLPFNSSNFSGLTTNYIDDTTSGANIVYSWISMDSNPINDSEELSLIGFDSSGSDVLSWIWNGTSFYNQFELSTASTGTGGYEAIATRYVSDGTRAIIATGDGTVGNFATAYWDSVSKSWSGITSTDIDASDGNDIYWVTLKPNPVNNDVQAVIVDSGADLATAYWNDSSSLWTYTPNIDITIDIATARPVDFSWVSDGSFGKLIWDTDAALGTLNQRTCSPLCTGIISTISTYADTGRWIALYRNPKISSGVNFIGIRLNALFNTGAFYYDGSYFSNYGDNTLTSSSGVSTYESFMLGFIIDARLPSSNFTASSPNNFEKISSSTIVINLSSNEPLRYALLELGGTEIFTDNYSLSPVSGTFQKDWFIVFNSLPEGNYSYKTHIIDWYGNIDISESRNFTINLPPNVTLSIPLNNTLNSTSRNITFYYNVSDTLDEVSSCSLEIDGAVVLIENDFPIDENVPLIFNYTLSNGQHNWTINCNDTNNFTSISDIRNLTISITPNIDNIFLTDNFSPINQIVLSAGKTRFVNCSVVVSDPEGTDNIVGVSAKLFYYLNSSGDIDNNNTHYTNNSCMLIDETSLNKTFSCGFDVWYYANNGTWYCNATVINGYSVAFSNNVSAIIQSLYAINLTDGLNFGASQSNVPSGNITVNITNFGNMPVNITIQGYAVFLGDNVGMNCSDNTNVTIDSIRFSTNIAANFTQKNSMNGSIQPLNFRINKQINNTLILNTTYWQISPNPGSVNRICGGYIIFDAQAS